MPLKLLLQSWHQFTKAYLMKKHSSARALKIAFGIVFKQLAVQFPSWWLPSSALTEIHLYHCPWLFSLTGMYVALGITLWLSAGSLLCQFECRPFHFFARYSQGILHSPENDFFFPGVDCSLELTTEFLFISQAYADCKDSVGIRAGGHLIHKTSRKGSQKFSEVWWSHLAAKQIFRGQQRLLRSPVQETTFSLSAQPPGPLRVGGWHSIHTEGNNSSGSLEHVDLSSEMTSWAFHILQKLWHMWL